MKSVAAVLAIAVVLSAQPRATPVKVVVVTMFERGTNTGIGTARATASSSTSGPTTG